MVLRTHALHNICLIFDLKPSYTDIPNQLASQATASHTTRCMSHACTTCEMSTQLSRHAIPSAMQRGCLKAICTTLCASPCTNSKAFRHVHGLPASQELTGALPVHSRTCPSPSSNPEGNPGLFRPVPAPKAGSKPNPNPKVNQRALGPVEQTAKRSQRRRRHTKPHVIILWSVGPVT